MEGKTCDFCGGPNPRKTSPFCNSKCQGRHYWAEEVRKNEEALVRVREIYRETRGYSRDGLISTPPEKMERKFREWFK